MKTRIFKCSLLPSIGFLLFSSIALTACEHSVNFVAATVKLNKSEIHMNVGEREKLVASVSKGYDSELRWFTSNESVAYADDGYVFGTGEGEATITAAYGGGYATCKVYVGDSGGGSPDAPKLNLSSLSQTIKVGASFDLSVTSVNPEDTTVTFTSGNTSIASIEQLNEKSVRVTGEAEGSTAITVKGSNNITKVCQVTVSDGGGASTEYNIAVSDSLNYSGSLSIGSPKNQRTFMEGLLKDFNTYTGSNIKFTIIDFEEDNGTSGYNSADAMPAVFPYASDQTMTLSQFKALGNVPNSDIEWIKKNMGDPAYKAASLTKCVGYPFAADNGLVMFYNKSVISDPEQISSLPKIFALAEQKDMEVNYPLNNGFYIAPALMSYNNGEPLYEVEPAGESYTATSRFNSDEGLAAAKQIRNIINNGNIRNATDAPRGDVLVTITDSSKVSNFKKQLGDNYAVAPLPYITDDANAPRIGSFLGYKFYGVNLQLSKDDQPKAQNVAKFLCSEYAQYKRFKEYNVRPTLLLDMVHAEFRSEVLAEPHIAALIKQSENNGVIPMKAVSSSLWSQTMVTYTELKKLSANAADSEYVAILKALDKGLNKTS